MQLQNSPMALTDTSSSRNSEERRIADMSKCKAVLDSKKIKKISVKKASKKQARGKSRKSA